MTPSTPHITWIGGVVRLRHFEHDGKPLRMAAWIEGCGRVHACAIVERNGPKVLRALLDEALTSTLQPARPTRLVVWPSVQAAFRDLEFPEVILRKDIFLRIVLEDRADYWTFPTPLQVRSA